MDQSPKGREIQPLTGDSAVIVARGNKIEELGKQMSEAADVLEQIATGELADGEMQGKAVAELQDKIGSSYETLREASELYTPVGPLIAAYGESVGDVQGKMQPLVDSCNDKWATYEALPGDREENDDEGQAKETAYNDWLDDAESWDAHYDTWEEAYDLAVNGVGDEMAGSIKDGFWEIFNLLIDILEIIGMVFMIAGILLGGVVAIIGFAIAGLVLIGRIVQIAAGECEVLDLVLAIVAVLPFGKLGNIAKGWDDATKAANLAAKGGNAGGKVVGTGGRGYGNFALKRAVPFTGPGVVTLGSKARIAVSISTGAKEVPRTVAAWKTFPVNSLKDTWSTALTGVNFASGVAIFGRLSGSKVGQVWTPAIDAVGGLGKWAGEWYSTVGTGQGLGERSADNKEAEKPSVYS